MKKISILFLSAVVVLSGSSCKKYLDVNQNPNNATSSTPDLVLPQAITYTAANVSAYNDYGAEVGGFAANGGGYGGFGVEWTYDYTTNNHTNLWSSAYDLLEDLQFVLNNTAGMDNYAYFNAAAKVLKAYNTEMLVDQYNDIPYSQALLGETVLAPGYDKATVIYQNLADLCDSAISIINNAKSPTGLTAGTDPLFAGNMTLWKQLANTIKLRLMIRASSKMTFTNTSFSSDGFLTTDAIVNPGYALASGHVSPSWGTWVVGYTGSAANRAWIPAEFVYGFYNGTKLTDNGRGSVIFNGFPNTPVNQLGITVNVPNPQATAGTWYSGGGSTGTALGNASGVMKGPNMGEPIMLAAESYFLQAEAAVRGISTGSSLTAKQAFNDGILASFKYLYELPNLTMPQGMDYAADEATYLSDNVSSYLVNFDLATSTDQQTEAIITQKYIALNFIHSSEGWNEYRRTGYPKTSPVSLNNGYYSMVSTQSVSSRPDKLPSRLLYPNTEFLYNDAHVPQGISPFTSLIFWAK